MNRSTPTLFPLLLATGVVAAACQSELESSGSGPSDDPHAIDEPRAGGSSARDGTLDPRCRDGVKNGTESQVDCGGTCLPCSESEADFYVSPRFGSDEVDGSRAQPFLSPHKAIEAARQLRAASPDRATPIKVLFREGTARLQSTVVLTSEDSGTAASPLVLAAYPGESPRFSGGRVIEGWRERAEAWTTTVPGVVAGSDEPGWAPNQLWVDGQRRYRPRMPQDGFHWIDFKVPPLGETGGKDNRMGYPSGALDPAWHRLEDVEVLIWHHWTISRMRIAELDSQENIVTFTGTGRCDREYCQFRPGYRFLVDNVKEALKDPGQWYLDQGTGELTYLPMAHEALGEVEIVMPHLRQLLEIKGSVDAPAQHIRLEGLTFEHSHFATPAEGYAPAQSDADLEAALEISDAQDISLLELQVEHTAEYGLAIRDRSKRVRVEGSIFRDLGSGGIRIGTKRAAPDAKSVISHHTVRDNLIMAGGRVHAQGAGILIQHAAHNLVEHNEVADFYYSGISVGWNWGYGASDAHHNEIANNRVHDIGQTVLSDMGGIYTVGVSSGTRVHHNVFHDIRRVRYGGWGIYPDQGSSNIRFDHNLVYDTQDSPFHLNFGENLTVENNVLIDDDGAGILRRSKAETGRHALVVERNVLVTHAGPAVTHAFDDLQYEFDHNLYYDPTGATPKWDGRSLAAWQGEGQDTQSVMLDPSFHDAASRDYRLGPESPARSLGIESLDLSHAGRVSGPVADDFEKAPRAFRRATGAAPLLVDFERTTAGKTPAVGSAHDGGNPASLVVTSEQAAASSKKSLLFTDSPHLKAPYSPHYVLDTEQTDGTFQLTFWLRIEDASKFVIELRNVNSSPYEVGPSLKIVSGELQVAGKTVQTLPSNHWVHFSLELPLGAAASGVFDLDITPAGQSTQSHPGLPCRDAVERIDYIGFISTATTAVQCYLDEVEGKRI